uniref:serine/threonine-protein kinase n=1 Tax=Herbidospora sakaeratensis TaxID=564415 RepID=UPI0007839BC7|nr:serine/threonine-protein kinase [Herbidospora sakaeratensis]
MSEASAPLVQGYEVLGILGQGGFGIVYRARQLAVGREVALKIDNRVLVNDRDRRRFMREVTSAGALSGHPNVADVYDAGVLGDGRPFMVLELCPGGSLADRLKDRGPFSVREVRDIGIKISDAVAAAHANGVLHRDIKPANILMNGYGQVALSDFGLATMPSKGEGAELSVTRESLTPAYAPPEAFELVEPTAQGDVYSLAATFYALLNGRPPRFPATGVANIAVIMALHRQPVPDVPGVPQGLLNVLRHALVTDPAQRTQTAAELRDALATLDADGNATAARPVAPVPAPPPYQPPPLRPPFQDVRVGGPGAVGPHTVSPHHGPVQHHAATRPPGYRPPPPPPARRTSPVGFVIAAVFFALLLGGGIAYWVIEGQRADPPATYDGAAPQGDDAGKAEKAAVGIPADVATYTENCAAAKALAGAACVKVPECWESILSLAGAVTAPRVGCEAQHAWETYAIAPMPADAVTWNGNTLEKHPTVAKLCSMATLLASRQGTARKVTADQWSPSVLPPTKEAFEAGDHSYRCVGAVPGKSGDGTYFAY